MMPPHGHERPARSGLPPRAGFGARPAAVPDPADAVQDAWEQDHGGPDSRDEQPRSARFTPGPSRLAADPRDGSGAQADFGVRSVFDPRRAAYPRPDDGPRPTFDPVSDVAYGGPRQRPGGAPGPDLRASRPQPGPDYCPGPGAAPRPGPDAGPGRGGPPPLPSASYSERIEQLLLAAQRQIADYVRAAAAEADLEANKIKAAAEGYAAGLRTSAEFERASSRAANDREAAKGRAAAEREREDLIRAARREADEIRRREQFLLEQSEALRSQAESDLEVELAGRREEAERLEAGRLADAQEATRKLVEEAERRAADAEKRAAEATSRAEQARKDAEADAKKEIADAHRKAELIIAQAKDDGKQALADFEADAAKRRAVLQKELDELTRQKAEIDDKLAQMRQLFAVGAFLDTPES
jgi:hypothetical protein